MSSIPDGMEAFVTADADVSVSPVSPAFLSTVDEQEDSSGATGGSLLPPVLTDLSHPELEAATTERHGERMQKPPLMMRKSDRGVSWEPDVTATGFPTPTLSPRNVRPSVERGEELPSIQRRLDLKVLMSTNPLESEAEAYIQRSLEETDPTMNLPHGSEAQLALLGPNVPLEASPDTFADEDLAAKTLMAQKSKSKLGHKKVKSTAAEDLLRLAMDLTELNQQHATEHADLETTGSPTTTAPSIIHAAQPLASGLTQRGVSRRKVLDPSSGSSADEAQPRADLAAERWDDLKRKAMAVNLSPPRPHAMPNTTLPAKQSGSKKTANVTKVVEDNGEEPRDEELAMPQETRRKDDRFRPSRSLSQRKRSQEAASRIRRASREKKPMERVKDVFKDFEDWFRVKKGSFLTYIKVILCVIVPATAIAGILFYGAGNPQVGSGRNANAGQANNMANARNASAMADASLTNATGTDGEALTEVLTTVLGKASWSWWILFVFVRQVLTLALAFATQAIIIEYAILRTKFFVRVFGSFGTLFVIQSRGWPFVIFMWSVFDYCFLWGGHPWTEHWLYWQDVIGLMNADNPSGNVTVSDEYLTVLVIMTTVSFTVMVKRFWLSLFLGKQTYIRYGADLARIMRKALLIGQVSGLARDKEYLGLDWSDVKNDLGIDLRGDYETQVEDDGSIAEEVPTDSLRSINSRVVNAVKSKPSLTRLQKHKINQLLGAWEEPAVTRDKEEKVPVSAIIQFRQSLTFLNTSRPFSTAFGPAATREECIRSSEAIYSRLVGRSVLLKFDLIALLAVDDRGEVDEEMLKELIRLFRPDREGNLSLLEFAKSIDTVYKELRLLRASVASSSKIDRAFENILNVIFYFLVILCVLAGVGIAPNSVLSPIGAFIVGLGFMIGSASSKYLEGILFILVRRPYDIGDRINISDPLKDTSVTGSPGWIVKDVNLYSTTVIFASTNEEATYSNGSLASARTINMARSFKAQISCLIKFPVDAPYEKLLIFKKSIEKFIASRPREFTSFVAFRATRVEADLGFVEYVVLALHRESWQEATTIAQSKADLHSFALELSKKMGLRYRSPPMPVDLAVIKQEAITSTRGDLDAVELPERLDRRQRAGTVGSIDVNSISALFEPRR